MRGVALGSKIAARVPVASLHPAPWNPRTLTEERFENLKRSLAADPRLLELRPILADAQGEVYAGNMRLRAAIALGWADVPAVLEDVDDLTRKERMVRDNAQWGEWQDDQLAEVLHSIAEAGADTSILGLEDADLTRILDGVRPAGVDDVPSLDEAPTRVNAGDLWEMGTHRLLCGDSADSALVGRLMDGKQADLLWTDPPYGVDYVEWDGAAGNADLLDRVFQTVSTVLRPGCAIYVAAPSGRNYQQFRDAFAHAGWDHHQTLVWVKDVFVLGHSDYHQRHELILYGWKGGARRTWIGRRTKSTVIDLALPVDTWTRTELEEFVTATREDADVLLVARPKRSVEHPTMKPVALIEPCLRNSSLQNAIVLDPFGGSGSTLIAAETLERRAHLVEISPRYCDVILARWEKLTGGTAVLQ